MAALLTTILLLGGCGYSYGFHYSTNKLDRDDASDFTIAKTEVEPITQIDIHSKVAEVELISSDKFYVEINYLYWEEKPEYSLENGVLFFDDSESLPDNYSIDFHLRNVIRIYLPQNSSLKKVGIEDASGDVSVEGFIAEELDITVAYGDLTMKKAVAADAEISLASGTSKITDFEVGKLDYTNSYGNAHFSNINTEASLLPEGSTHEQFNATLSSGDIEINGLNSTNIELSNSYGDISCDKVTAEDMELELSSGNAVVDHSDILSSDITNSYGDVTLTLAGAAADYSLDLDTSYGKIKVDGKSYEEHRKVDNNGSRSIAANLSSGDIKVDFE
jgi:DUF4097 and DUF4098 domain-containing protein YvlB